MFIQRPPVFIQRPPFCPGGGGHLSTIVALLSRRGEGNEVVESGTEKRSWRAGKSGVEGETHARRGGRKEAGRGGHRRTDVCGREMKGGHLTEEG